MVVVVLTAIYIVGIFLLWDVFNVESSLDTLMNTDFYADDLIPASDTKVDISVGGIAVTNEEELLLRDFFTFWYAGLGAGKAEKISRFYTVQTSFELFDELALDYEIFLSEKSPLDLSFDKCSLVIDLTRRHERARTGSVEIDAGISAVIDYKYSDKPSVIRGEKHSFLLSRTDKKLLIEEHTSDRPCAVFSGYALDRILSENKLVRSDLNYTYFPKYTAAALDALKKEVSAKKFALPDKSSYPAAEYSYDRNTAANTAINGFASSGIFKQYDENDANFISRCIFESGIPMDAQGGKYDQWKWYDEEINNDRKKTGCSASWFDRTAFYRYIRENTGFGMSACLSSDGGGELGDVVMLMHDGEPVREFMITGVAAASDGTVKDYLVSNDRYASVSLKSLGCTDICVLHIVGYNTANI